MQHFTLVPGELAEAVAAGLTDGIAHTCFPQPGHARGTLGVQLESGALFFSAAELALFWAEEANEAQSETESMLAADEEGLEHLQVPLCCSISASLCS